MESAFIVMAVKPAAAAPAAIVPRTSRSAAESMAGKLLPRKAARTTGERVAREIAEELSSNENARLAEAHWHSAPHATRELRAPALEAPENAGGKRAAARRTC